MEGTGGNTGVSLALFANQLGYRAIFTMPQKYACAFLAAYLFATSLDRGSLVSVSQEKIDTMRLFGAEVILQPIVPFSDQRHYVHRAQEIAKSTPGAVYMNQFENTANSQAHFETTGPEIWAQTSGKIQVFVAAAGTGGTISGCSRCIFMSLGAPFLASSWLNDSFLLLSFSAYLW